jgi:hypothetical protein
MDMLVLYLSSNTQRADATATATMLVVAILRLLMHKL